MDTGSAVSTFSAARHTNQHGHSRQRTPATTYADTHTRATQTLNMRTPPPSKHPTQHQHQTPSIRTTKPNPQLNPNKTANPPTQSTPRPQNPNQQPNTPPQRKNNHPHQNQKYQHTGSGQQRRREKKKRKGLERRKEERRRKRRKEKRKISAHGFEPRTAYFHANTVLCNCLWTRLDTSNTARCQLELSS